MKTDSKNNILKKQDSVTYLAFPAFEQVPELVCGFSTRLGGVSEGCFSSMNLGFRRGDASENVFENYRRICNCLGIMPEQLVFPDQVHETVVRHATKQDIGKGIFRERDYSGVDSQITDERGVALVVFGADCVPVFFYDSVHHAIGTAHAGWRGTVGGIVKNTIHAMKEQFGTNPADVKAVIGPSIGPECFEVGDEVAEIFSDRFDDRADIIERSYGEKPHINLWKANQCLLCEAGVKEENISVSGLCTRCDRNLFFSHRQMGNERGSMAGFLMLKENEIRNL